MGAPSTLAMMVASEEVDPDFSAGEVIARMQRLEREGMLFNAKIGFSNAVQDISKTLSDMVSSLGEYNEMKREDGRILTMTKLNANTSGIFGSLSEVLKCSAVSGITIPEKIRSEIADIIYSYRPYYSIDKFDKLVNEFIEFVRGHSDIHEIEQERDRIDASTPSFLPRLSNYFPMSVNYSFYKYLLEYDKKRYVKIGPYTIIQERIWSPLWRDLEKSDFDLKPYPVTLDITYNGNIYTPLEYFTTTATKDHWKKVFSNFTLRYEDKIIHTNLILPEEYIEEARNNYQKVCVLDMLYERYMKFRNSKDFIKSFYDSYYNYYLELSNKLGSIISAIRMCEINATLQSMSSQSHATDAGQFGGNQAEGGVQM